MPFTSRCLGDILASKATAINNYVQNPSGVWIPAKSDALGNTSASIISDYPLGAIAITGQSGNQANATATATLAANATRTTYISGFEVTGTGATGVLIVLVTVVGTITGTLTYVYVFVAGVTTQNTPLIVQFSKAIPGSAINTAIVVSCPASGAGGTNNAVNAHGYQL